MSRKPLRKKLPWEKLLPSPPAKAEVIRSVIFKHVLCVEARPVPAIYRCVLDDYGLITDRTVYRHLRELVKEGKIVRVHDDSEDTFGYVRASRPRWDRVEQVYA